MIMAFVVFAPFLYYAPVTIIHIMFCILLMLHWITNQNICFLTVLEAKFKNKPLDQTLIHEILEPIYKIQENSLNILIWTFTISITLYSIYTLYKNENFQKSITKTKERKFKEALVILFS